MSYIDYQIHGQMRKMSQLDHEVYTPKETVELAKAWCHEQWGARWDVLDNRHGTWSVFWAGFDRPKQYRWCFATAQQAVLFSLRWQK